MAQPGWCGRHSSLLPQHLATPGTEPGSGFQGPRAAPLQVCGSLGRVQSRVWPLEVSALRQMAAPGLL